MKKKSTISKIIVPLLLLATMLICFSCSTEIEFVQKPQRSIPPDYMSEKENKIILITNEYRVADELTPYKTSLDLYHLAKGRVYYMAEKDSLSHFGFYPAYLESGALFYGESISCNFVTAEDNLEAFHNSENHWPMFISPIYEYIAVACEGRYTVVLVARWRPYNSNGKRVLEIKSIRTGNLITTEVKP